MGEAFFIGLAKFAAAAAVSYEASAIAAAAQDAPEAEVPGIKVNTRSTQAPLRAIYGQCKVAGNDVFYHGQGKWNDIMWVVMTLGEGEIEGIVQEYDDAKGQNVDQLWFGDKLVWLYEFVNVAGYTLYTGTSTQTYHAQLNVANPAWTDNMRHTAYIVFWMYYGEKGARWYQGVPLRTVAVKGLKVYDFRDGSTAWSDNPVLCLYDYMTNARYGLGLASSVIDITSWSAAANYCDTKNWTLNLALYEDEAAIDVVRRMLGHFRGTLVWYDGQFYLRYADVTYESSVMTIEDYHILQDEEGKASVRLMQPSIYNKPDGVRVKWTDPDRNYVEDDINIGDSSGVVRDVPVIGCKTLEHASALGLYNLERLKLDRVVSGVFSDDCVKLEPHDLVTFNSTALGIGDQLMRVLNAAIRPDGNIDMVLAFEAAVLYDDDYNLDVEDVYECSLPDVTEEPPPVSNVTVTEETYTTRGRTFTRLNIAFSDPTDYPWFHHVDVFLSYDNSNWTYLYPVNTDFSIDPVDEGVTYYIRLKTVNRQGAEQEDANDYKIARLVEGLTAQPDSLAALQVIVNPAAVILFAEKLAGSDIDLYEFRMGSSWSAGIFMGALAAPNLPLPFVKPGSHTFWANSLSNNGEYGATPRSGSVTLIDPPDDWAVSDSDTCDYNGVGTHSNTEHTTYDSDDYLKCSHAGGVLTGTYTSPEYDLGSSTRVLVYVLADIAVTGVGTTWDDKLPAGTTFGEAGVPTLTWAELFELTAGCKVTMRIYYGDVSGTLTDYVDRAEILAAIVTGRYFQVQITIEDPAEDVNALVENFTIKYCT